MDCYTTEYVPPYYGHPNDPRNDGRLDAAADLVTEAVSAGMDPQEAFRTLIDWDRPRADEIRDIALQQLIDNGDLPEDYKAA